MNIFVYKQKCKKCQNGFLKSTKHGFSHDYFLHIWPPSRVKNLNLMNVNKYANDWIKKLFPLQPITSKCEDFEIFVWFIFSSNWSNENVIAERETFFSGKFCLKSIALFLAFWEFFCI